MRILQIGRYPPPFGGVTIHVQRLAEYCRANGFECEVLDLYRQESTSAASQDYIKTPQGSGLLRSVSAVKLLRSQHPDIAHYHVSAMGKLAWVAPILFSQLRSRRRILTIHHGSFTESYAQKSSIEQSIIRQILSSMDAVVFPTEDLQSKVLSLLGKCIRRSEVASTFIAFESLGQSETFLPLDEFVQSLSLNSTGRPPILLISGYGFPRYGFDLLYKAVQSLTDQGIHVAVVVSFYGSGDSEYMETTVANFARCVPVLVVRDLSASAFRYLLSKSDIYVRPTTTDSCGVTVYESLSLGTVCVASDVCTRPPGTILHQSEDAESLEIRLRHALDMVMTDYDKSSHMVKLHGGEREILEIYNDLVRGEAGS